MSPILLSSEHHADEGGLASRLANRIACYRARGDATDARSLREALRRDGFSEDETGEALEHALAILAGAA